MPNNLFMWTLQNYLHKISKIYKYVIKTETVIMAFKYKIIVYNEYNFIFMMTSYFKNKLP